MPIIFSNPGLIDPRLITVLGVNVKEGTSPIGFFGTGLKYAISVLLRNQCSIHIYAGQDAYAFSTREETIRGKTFSVVHMNDQPLGFTTELGKNWKPWMALRELYSNAKDEGGDWRLGDLSPKDLPGNTVIVVDGTDALDAYAQERLV